MAITDLGQLASYVSSKVAAATMSPVNLTGSVIPAGTLLHIVGCWDNIASVTAPVITCSTVGGATPTANHPTALGQGVTTTAGSGIWHQCFRVLTTADIATNATIVTLTSNQSAVARACTVNGFSGASTTLRGTNSNGVNATGTISLVALAPQIGDLVIGSVSFENGTQMSGDTDTLNGSWSAIAGDFTTGGGAATNAGVGVQAKIVTAAGDQTFNASGGLADTVGCVYILTPTTAVTYAVPFLRGVCTGGNDGQSLNQTTQVLTLPVGCQPGDVLAWISTLQTGAATLTGDTFASTVRAGPQVNAGLTQTVYIATHTLTAGDISAGSDTITWTAAARELASGVVWANVDESTITVGTPSSQSTSTSFSTPTVTAGAANEVILLMSSTRAASATAPIYTLPGTYTQDTNVVTTYGANSQFRSTIAHLTTPGAPGVYGGNTLTLTGAPTSTMTYSVALAPSVVPGPATQNATAALTATSTLSTTGGQVPGVSTLPTDFTASQWTLAGAATATSTRLTLPGTSSSTTTGPYSLGGQRVFWKFAQVPTDGYLKGGLRLDANNYLLVTVSDNSLIAWSQVFGGVSDVALSTGWDPSQPFISLRETGGTIYIEKSASGQPGTWTQVSLSSTISTIRPFTYSAPFRFESQIASGRDGWIESLNTPVTLATAALTASSTLTVTAVQDQPATVALTATSTLSGTGGRAPSVTTIPRDFTDPDWVLTGSATATPTRITLGASSQAATATSYTLAGARVFWKVAQQPVGGNWTFGLISDASNYIRLVLSNPTTVLYKFAVGGVSKLNNVFTWDPAKPFLAFREAAGTVYIERSADGVTWEQMDWTTGAAFLLSGCPLTFIGSTGITTPVWIESLNTPTQAGAVPLIATSTLIATVTSIGTTSASADLTATSTLVATAVRQPEATASLTATSTLVATGVRDQPAVAALAASSTLTATAFRGQFATVAMTATGALSATGVREPQGAASLTATSTLSVTALRSVDATVAMSAVSTFTAQAVGVGITIGTAPLVAVSTLTATAFRVLTTSASLTASSTLTVTGVRQPQATASLTATSTLTATGGRTAQVSAPLTAVSTLTATAIGVTNVQATVALTASSTLIVVAVRTPQAVASLVATSTLLATATRSQSALASLTVVSTLTVDATRTPQAAGSLTATSTLVVVGVHELAAMAQLTAVATLTAAAARGKPSQITNVSLDGTLHAKDSDGDWHPLLVVGST